MAERIVNDLTKGMIRKVNPLKKEQNFYNFALNITTDKNRIDRTTKVCENLLEDYYSLKNTNYVILNSLYLNLDEYVFFITDKSGSFSEILYYKDGSITTKYSNSELNFKASNIISSTYRVNYNGDRIIYFVDGFNKDRVFNLDNINLTDDIESISMNPVYDYTSYSDYTINYTGGSLKSGKYYIFINPIDFNGKESIYKNLIDGLPIQNGDYKEELSKTTLSDINDVLAFKEESNNFYDVKGLPSGDITSKSITLSLDIYNQNFNTANIYIVLRTDTTTEVYLKENITIGGKYTINNLDDYINLGTDVSSILVDNIIYNKSETLTQKNNRLLLANSTLESYDINFQDIANNIKVRPLKKEELFNTSDFVPNSYRVFDDNQGKFVSNNNSISQNQIINERDSFSTPYYLAKTQKVSLTSKTFMRDEVYALGVYFELDNGSVTDVYHIPGRKANDPDILNNYIGLSSERGRLIQASSIPNWDTYNVTIDGVTDEAWKLLNTGAEGLLGYYRCDNVYPDGYGYPTDGEQNISGKSYIRHHRIPSEYIYPVLTTGYIANDNYFHKKNIINLEFYDINIPSDIQDKVKKINFCIANRTENDKKVISKGIVYSSRNISNGVVRNSEMLNIPNSYQNETKNNKIFEFKSPDVDFRFKSSNIRGSFMKSTSVLSGGVSHASKVPYQNHTGTKDANKRFPSPGAVVNYEGINRSTTDVYSPIYDYKQELVLTRAFYNHTSNLTPGVSLKQKAINDMQFVDNNSNIAFGGVTLNNEGNQNTSYIELKNETLVGDNTMFDANDLLPYVFNDFTSLKNQSSNLFRNFFIQNQNNYKDNYSVQERDISKEIYFDSTHMVTILSSNNNIFSEILNLTYSRIVTDENNIAMGDSFIENHFSKKGYSTLVTNSNYRTVGSVYNQKDAYLMNRYTDGDFSEFLFGGQQPLDMSVSESYICFPVETRINIRMRRDSSQENHYPNNIISSTYPVNVLEKKALTQETYNIDRVFLNENSIKPIFSNSVKVNDLDNLVRKIGNRIIYSDLQNNESPKDSFRIFKANNYKDIITTKGNINKLFVKDDNLYVITRDSLFRINSNNNQLSTKDGGSIYVETGEFLGTNPVEIISLELGYAGTMSKLSFSESKYGYLYVDSIRNRIILFSRDLNDININGLEEDLSINLFKYFPQLNDGLDKPLLGYGILTGFDPETDRLFITKFDYKPTSETITGFNNGDIVISDGLFYKNDILIDFNNSDYFENKSFTVTYDAVNNLWISYHSYFPEYYIQHPSKLVVKDNSIYTKKYGENYVDKFIIDVLFNENQGLTKVFDSIQFDIKSESIDEEFTENFFNQIILYTDNQSTGLVNLDSVYPSNNLTKKNGYWNFSGILDISKDKLNKKLFLNDWNSVKNNYFIDKVVNNLDLDTNKDWYNKKRIRNKVINVRLFKNNLENNKFFINFAILNYRNSIR